MNNSKMEGTSESRLAQFLVAAARGCFLYTKMTLDFGVQDLGNPYQCFFFLAMRGLRQRAVVS